MINRGIVVNRFLETNIDNVYAIGDCAEFSEPTPGRRPLEQVWYTGRMMGEAVAKTITGTRSKYLPGIWFNSAKFFDIEYQTYGGVLPQIHEKDEYFSWKHPTKNVLFRAVFESKSKRLEGVNCFGMRLRHEVFERWLTGHKTIEFVLEHLKDAVFDPEFYSQYEKDIIDKYNNEYNTKLVVKKKSWTRILNLKK